MDGSLMRDQKVTGGINSSRRKFTADVIKAIEELEIRRVSRSPEQLAAAAWQKLQYDLPVLEVAELEALLEQLRSSLQGKTSWPCYTVTSKALENITSGAKRSSSFEPVLPEHEQQLQQLIADSISTTIRNKTSTMSSAANSGSKNQGALPSAVTKQQQQQADAQATSQTPQQLYQQLCAVVLLQYIAKVVSLPEQEAWQLLQDFHPEAEAEADQQALLHPHQQQQLVQQEQLLAQAGLDGSIPPQTTAEAAGAAAMGGSDAGFSSSAVCVNAPSSTTTASTSIYELQEAAEQDEDGDVYEAVEPMEQPTAATCGTSCGGGSRPWQSDPRSLPSSLAPVQQPAAAAYSWPALRYKLLSIADSVHYSLLNFEPLWGQQQAAQHLLQLLRALGVHSHAQQLQPLLHAYVGLLVDRLAAAPADLPLLQQLWEALGLTGLAGQGIAAGFGGVGKSRGRRQQSLPPEAVLGLSVAAAVWQQLPGSSARSKLWRLMYENLLPVLEQCSEQLAYNSNSSAAATAKGSGSSSRSSAGSVPAGATVTANGTTAAAGAGQQQVYHGESFAHMLLLCHIVELLVVGRPSSVDAAGQLTQLGVVRNLVQLFAQHGSDAAAEPLRRALLLASCSSNQTASWVLAVPQVLQQLQQQAFQIGGSAEAHGALWELLMNRNSKQQAAAATSKAGATAGDVGCQQLLGLLGLSPASVQQLQRQLALLQLLVDVQKAAGRQQSLLGDANAALRQLAGSIKELPGTAAASGDADGSIGQTKAARDDADDAGDVTGSSTNTICSTRLENGHMGAAATAAAAVAKQHSHDASIGPDVEDDDSGEASAAAGQQQQQRGRFIDEHALEHRQSQQLQPAALKLIKELLTQGGKTE